MYFSILFYFYFYSDQPNQSFVNKIQTKRTMIAETVDADQPTSSRPIEFGSTQNSTYNGSELFLAPQSTSRDPFPAHQCLPPDYCPTQWPSPTPWLGQHHSTMQHRLDPTSATRNPTLPSWAYERPHTLRQSQFGTSLQTEPQQSQFGTSTDAKYDLNNPSSYSQWNGLMSPEMVQHRHYDSLHPRTQPVVTRPSFQMYPQTPGWGHSPMYRSQYEPLPKATTTSSNFNYNYTHLKRSRTETVVHESQEIPLNLGKENQTPNKTLKLSTVIEEKYDFTCVICQDSKKDTVLLPCRHLCVCRLCSESIELCPLCRQKFEQCMTVYT